MDIISAENLNIIPNIGQWDFGFTDDTYEGFGMHCS
jgi:hypothetical protein